jgi:spore coat polysaccharide biosynthesis protein SpsF
MRLLDTAAMYGDAERVLGEVLRPDAGFVITTKTMTGTTVKGIVDRARQSHRLLGGRPLHGLLVHSAGDLRGNNGPELWRELQILRDEGLFTRLGISAYASDDPIELARRYRPDIIQLPLSVFDQRPIRSGLVRALKDFGVEIHARSVFLQGIIFLDPALLPVELAHVRSKLEDFHSRRRGLSLSPLQVGIGFPLSIPEIDHVIVGVTTADEAREIVATTASLPAEVPWQEFAIDDEILLDPRRWGLATQARPPAVLAVLQARMSSRRLPGKVLKPILGRPMLGRHLDRLRRCEMIDRIVVATSMDESDDPIAAFCDAEGIDCHRGSLDDVLGRFEDAVNHRDPIDHVVRLTADCPLADPEVIDGVIRMHLSGRYDFSANTIRPTFPDGLDVEVMTRDTLRLAASEASSPYDREHVTAFIYSRPDRFKLGSFENSVDQRHMRWTVDTQDDFRMVEAVYQELLPIKDAFVSADVLALLERRPDLASINSPAAQTA